MVSSVALAPSRSLVWPALQSALGIVSSAAPNSMNFTWCGQSCNPSFIKLSWRSQLCSPSSIKLSWNAVSFPGWWLPAHLFPAEAKQGQTTLPVCPLPQTNQDAAGFLHSGLQSCSLTLHTLLLGTLFLLSPDVERSGRWKKQFVQIYGREVSGLLAFLVRGQWLRQWVTEKPGWPLWNCHYSSPPTSCRDLRDWAVSLTPAVIHHGPPVFHKPDEPSPSIGEISTRKEQTHHLYKPGYTWMFYSKFVK